MKNDGPDRSNHSLKCHQRGQARDCLGDHSRKSRARKKTLSGICGKVMVLMGDIIFVTFTNIVRQGIVFGTILKKVRPVEKPYQEYLEK